MKKILLVFVMALLLPLFGGAQDARQRAWETVVADGLAQLPASTPAVFNQVMSEMAATGERGIHMLADMLVPAGKGENATVEYALNGLVAYVSAKGHEAQADGVRKGLVTAVDQCKDPQNQAFLLTLLGNCSTQAEVPTFVKYVKSEQLADASVRGLILTAGSEETLLQLIDQSATPDARLAYAAAEKGLTKAEPQLLRWATVAKEEATKRQIYYALSRCGTAQSLPVLKSAAESVGYGFDRCEAPSAYMTLLSAVVASGDAKALKTVASLTKGKPEQIRVAALGILLQNDKKSRTKLLLNTLKDASREYRCAALDDAVAFANDDLYASLAKAMPKLDVQAQTDVVNWLGTRHATKEEGAVVTAIGSKDKALACAAIRAAGKIGGREALNALIAQLGGPHAEEAAAAISSFNGKPNDALVAALDGTPATQIQVLNLVAERRIKQASDKVFGLLNSSDAQVRAAAYEALAGVTSPRDFERLCDQLDKAQAPDVKPLQAGLKNALADETPAVQYEKTIARMSVAPEKARYYPLLAQAGNKEAIDALLAAQGQDQQTAFESLLTVKNPAMVEVLYNLARQHAAGKDAALTRYTDFVVTSSCTGIRKYQLYRRALELSPSTKVQNKLLGALARTEVFPALALATGYLDNPETAEAAALVVKTTAAKHPELGGEVVRKALERAQQVYAAQAKSDPDAGYAVDEIKGLLNKLPKEGFVPVDLSLAAWRAVVPADVKAKALKKAQAAADAALPRDWSCVEGVLSGKAGAIASKQEYENFELQMEYLAEGEPVLGVRSQPQFTLNGKETGEAINPAEEWNTLQLRVVDDRMTALLNGQSICRNEILNTADSKQPVAMVGALLLDAVKGGIKVRECYANRLPSTPRFVLSKEEAKEGFEVLFDGTSMHKWTGNTTDYVPDAGTIYVTAGYGGTGNLYTIKEYANFILRFEFRFDVEGVNNGIGIRTPMGVDAAYEGMEIQVLDHDAPIYKGLHIYQQHGSVYGVVPAKHVHFPPRGTWNVEEIRAEGDHITVTVNGEEILNANIREACQGHNVAPDGGKTNPYTVDHRNHPGLFNKSGHIGLLGHGAGVRFRNLRIKELPATKK